MRRFVFGISPLQGDGFRWGIDPWALPTAITFHAFGVMMRAAKFAGLSRPLTLESNGDHCAHLVAGNKNLRIGAPRGTHDL